MENFTMDDFVKLADLYATFMERVETLKKDYNSFDEPMKSKIGESLKRAINQQEAILKQLEKLENEMK